MKKLLILVGVLTLYASTAISQGLNLDQILENHSKAVGFDKLQSVKTIVMTGSMITNVIMPLKTIKVRPNKYRQERDVVDITGVTVFDGQIGWFTAPWSGNPKPQVAAEPQLTPLKVLSDFDGTIYNWKAKGHNAELNGTEKIGDTDAYKIKLTRADGGIEYYFIDSKSFLILKKVGYQNIRGKETEVANIYSDYRNTDGIMLAYASESIIGGQPSSSTQYDTIELNTTVDDKIFVMPVK